jgi:hypothetical protein
MKTILFSLLLFSSTLQAKDQGMILAQGRDLHLKMAMNALRDYCPVLDLYVCRVKLQSDCSHGRETKSACAFLKNIEEQERRVVLSDKQISEAEPIDLGEGLKGIHPRFCVENKDCRVETEKSSECPTAFWYSVHGSPQITKVKCGSPSHTDGAICVNNRCYPNQINVAF